MMLSNESLDIRPYIRVILDKWKSILFIVSATVIISIGVSRLRPANYQASATAVITRQQMQLSLTDKNQTVIGENLASSQSQQSQLKAFILITESDSIAMQPFSPWGMNYLKNSKK